MQKMPILLGKKSLKSQQKSDLMLTTLILLLDFQAINHTIESNRMFRNLEVITKGNLIEVHISNFLKIKFLSII